MPVFPVVRYLPSAEKVKPSSLSPPTVNTAFSAEVVSLPVRERGRCAGKAGAAGDCACDDKLLAGQIDAHLVAGLDGHGLRLRLGVSPVTLINSIAKDASFPEL